MRITDKLMEDPTLKILHSTRKNKGLASQGVTDILYQSDVEKCQMTHGMTKLRIVKGSGVEIE